VLLAAIVMSISVKDVDTVADDLEDRRDLPITLEDKPYGMRDFGLPDLNGYVIAFGSRLIGYFCTTPITSTGLG